MMKRFFFIFPVLGLAIPLILQGCSPVGAALGAGATVGISAAQEGGVARAWDDGVIQAKINERWLRHDVNMFSKLDLTVNNGRVLITGVVQDPEHRVEAVRLAWQPNGVQQVINEIQVADKEGVSGFIRDNWISTRLRSAITIDRDVQSINYNIDTVRGVVYLMGFAQNQLELNRVIETARTIPNVKQVVSYVKIITDGSTGVEPANVNWEDRPATEYNAPVQGEPINTSPNAAYNAPIESAPIDNSAYESGNYDAGGY